MISIGLGVLCNFDLVVAITRIHNITETAQRCCLRMTVRHVSERSMFFQGRSAVVGIKEAAPDK